MDPRYKSPTAAVADHDSGAEFEFRDLTSLTAVVAWLLRIGAVLAVVGIGSSWLQLELLSNSFSPEDGTANDRRETLILGATAVLMIATSVIFARWILVAHRNLPALGAQRLEVRPGWAVGYFFVPILNWWKPYQAMRSLWRSSHDVHRPELEESTWVLPTWWTLWLLVWFLFNGASRMPTNSILDLQIGTVETLIGRVLYAALCLVASRLVSRVWRAQAAQRDSPAEAPKGFADAAA